MNTAIGIYNDHELAVAAVQKLKDSNYPLDRLTIMGKAETEVVDEEMHLVPRNPINLAGVGTGTAIGTALGILTGVGIFAIPGLGFLYGAGALVGAIAGFDFGLIGGGIASALTTIGVKDENEQKYHKALEAGKFLLIVHGSEEDVNNARAILHLHGTHNDITYYPRRA
ncbi:hypothetical protein GCM10023093_12800 [Nemorincola caseinilytica]|uniref:Heat induced stress protein YflT n=1 Tax=Nemorincola caseinilytica TaxID=2054315 RepID=A0ABP8NE08_9BACT